MKGKLLGLSNNEESVWYEFAPEDGTLKNLNEIFDFYDNFYPGPVSYKRIKKWGETSINKTTKDYIAYFIFTQKKVHLILLKKKKWEQVHKKIFEVFEFVKPKVVKGKKKL